MAESNAKRLPVFSVAAVAVASLLTLLAVDLKNEPMTARCHLVERGLLKDVCRGSCQAGECTVTKTKPYFKVLTQAAACGCVGISVGGGNDRPVEPVYSEGCCDPSQKPATQPPANPRCLGTPICCVDRTWACVDVDHGPSKGSCSPCLAHPL